MQAFVAQSAFVLPIRVRVRHSTPPARLFAALSEHNGLTQSQVGDADDVDFMAPAQTVDNATRPGGDGVGLGSRPEEVVTPEPDMDDEVSKCHCRFHPSLLFT
jgi:hypothetical protein